MIKSLTQILNKVFNSTLEAIKVTDIGGFSAPDGADTLTREATSSTIDTFRYRAGGISGTILTTIVVTYPDALKNEIDSVVKI